MRQLAVLLCAATGSLLLASCLGVLGLDGYESAPEALCALLDRCYTGEDAIVQCRGHVSSQLAAAGEGRDEWLARFTSMDSNCLTSCSNARACLDAAPVCRGPRESCTKTQQCCGFTGNLALCVREECCKPKSAPCSSSAECCEELCVGDPKTCGGTQCAEEGKPCDLDGDGLDDNCCSGLCNPDTHLCAPKCRENSFDCQSGFECCSGTCQSGKCAPCRPDGQQCLHGGDCCSGTCDTNLGICGMQGCRDVGEFCTADSQCCSGFCPPFGECSEPDKCDENGVACLSGDACCSGHCENDSCQCASDGASCFESFECCSGSCVDGTCGQCLQPGTGCGGGEECCSGLCKDGACCIDPGCDHDICTEGAGLSAKGCLASGMTNGLVQAECIALICESDPRCCCDAWTQADCVSKVVEVCKLSCSQP